MFTILFFLLAIGLLTYQNMQASKRRAAEAQHRKEEDEKMPKVAVDREFIARLNRDGVHVPADIGSIAKILHQWEPNPAGSESTESDWDEIAEGVVKQLRQDVDAQKVARVLSENYLRKYARRPENAEGIANYIVNWWRAYILA